MTKRQIAKNVKIKSGLTIDLAKIFMIIDTYNELIVEKVKEEGEFNFPGWGKYYLSKSKGGKIKNIFGEGKEFEVKPFYVLRFLPSKKVRKEIKKVQI